ncbi:MAG: beta-lactamase family protein [Oscillospiraceae bacterium]|nr:beta-lactamase family protein [Oscillospiraceae bacterium]
MKLQRSAPERQGVKSQAIIDFLTKIKEENHELHSFMLLKNGKVISECWWEPYGPGYRHQLFSLSKSFTSTAIGFAVSEGLLSVDTLLFDIFKKEIEELGGDIDEKIKKMSVKHLLTMGTGMDYENWGFGGDNIKNFLSSHIRHEPGSTFFYHTLGTYMQSATITKLTGQRLVDYLMPRLFAPLGIDPYWEQDDHGISFGGFGLNITTEDIAKFGQLYLQDGIWGNRRILPEDWVTEATQKQIENGDDPKSDWAQGYGYQFWRCKPKGVYRGDGAYGQFCIVMPKENAVVAITSNSDMQRVMDLIWEILLPALGSGDIQNENRDAKRALTAAQSGLSHLKVDLTAPNFPKIRGEYKNPEGTFGLYLDISETDGVMAISAKNAGNVSAFRFKKGEWMDGASYLFRPPYHPFTKIGEFMRNRTYANWNPNENIFDLTAWFYETPVKNSARLKFDKSKTKLALSFDNGEAFELEFVKGSDFGLGVGN